MENVHQIDDFIVGSQDFSAHSLGGYMSKKLKLDLIVCLYYQGNLIVRLAWNVPYDGEGLQRQNFLLYPFP